MKFLLRVLVADGSPMESLLDEQFRATQWEQRFQALTRIFRIMLDICHPDFYIDGRQWRASIASIFMRFFRCMWEDPKVCVLAAFHRVSTQSTLQEEIRLTADTWAHTLLPVHYKYIGMCWDEYATSAPMDRRQRLVSFLIQLHCHFPTWQSIAFLSRL